MANNSIQKDFMNKAKEIVRENIITTMEVAEILGCTRQYIDKLVKEGKIPLFKQTKRDKLFWKDDILVWKSKKLQDD